MPTVMKMRWDGLTPEHYDAARDEVRWEEDTPEGGIFHVAWFADGALHVVDVWESEEHWNRFLGERLMPTFAKLDFPGEPKVKTFEAHRHFAPAYMART